MVLTESGLEHIARHEYKPGKYTPLDLLLNPYWFRLAEALPRWLAPNLVTLLGFLPLVGIYAVCWFISPGFATPPPRWLSLSMTLVLYFYQTMDALDGKQARRTASSTPLGQLFDHGCDCLACVSQHTAAAMVLLPGASSWGLFSMSALQSAFFMAQWQEYHTGVLRTSYGPVGVTETQVVLMLMSLWAAVVGPEAVDAATSAHVELFDMSVKTVIFQAWIIFMCALMVICLGKVVWHAVAERGSSGATCVKDLLPVLVLNPLLASWNPSLVELAPREVGLITSLLFFYFAAQMILFSMARMPFPVVQKWLLPYVALVGLSWISPVTTRWLLVAAILVLIIWLLRWLVVVVEQLKRKLNICAFSITKKYHCNGNEYNGYKKS